MAGRGTTIVTREDRHPFRYGAIGRQMLNVSYLKRPGIESNLVRDPGPFSTALVKTEVPDGDLASK